MVGDTLGSAIYNTASWVTQLPMVYWEMGQVATAQPMKEMEMGKGENYDPR